MADIRSVESQRAEFRRWGSPDLGTTDPILHKGTQIKTTLFQKGSRCGVTKTGVILTFSPAFSSTPNVIFSVRAFAPGSIESAGLKNPHSSGGTLCIGKLGGTKVVDYLAWDPTR